MKFLGPPQSGSVAGQTSSRNRFGQYYRSRAVPVNPLSGAQVDARARLSTQAHQWRTLDVAEQGAWTTYAIAHPRVDSLGQAIVLTGFQMFVAVNAARTASGVAADDAPPVDVIYAPNRVSGVTATAPDTIEVTHGVIPADYILQLWASLAVSAGVSFMRDFRLITNVPAGIAGVSDIGAAWIARFGNLTAGTKVFVRANLIADGVPGPVEDFSAIVA
jgi:hypothetical protein